MGSLPGFGCDQLPIGIARGEVARKSPYIRHIGDFVGTAVDHVAVAITRDRHELRHEAHRDLGALALHFGTDDVGLVDRYEPRLGLLAARLAFLDGGPEAIT